MFDIFNKKLYNKTRLEKGKWTFQTKQKRRQKQNKQSVKLETV